MKRITRREAQAWLKPILACLHQMRSGEVDAIKGYPVTRLNVRDDYVRTDWCIAGFRGLMGRLRPDMDTGPLLRLEAKLANGVPIELSEIDSVGHHLKLFETAMLKMSRQQVKNAVLTEQIAIELDGENL